MSEYAAKCLNQRHVNQIATVCDRPHTHQYPIRKKGLQTSRARGKCHQQTSRIEKGQPGIPKGVHWRCKRGTNPRGSCTSRPRRRETLRHTTICDCKVGGRE